MRRFLPVVGAALVLAVTLLTMAPTLSWAHHGADGGDLVTAVALGSIPHPPGFPTYLLLGEFFIRIPLGNPAWRLNLLSAMAAAAAAGLTTATVQRLRTGCSWVGALCAGLGLGLAPLFWSQALIAEVYTLAAFFAALVILLAVGGGPAWAVGLMWGLGLGAHPLLVFLAPVAVWGAWRREDGERRTERGGWTKGKGEDRLKGVLYRLVQTELAAMVGWGVMYGPGLLMRRGVPSPWANLGTLDGWWGLVSGQLYRGYVFALPLAAWPRRLAAWAGLLARQFTPVGAVVAGVGWAALRRERSGLAVASLVSFGAFSVYAIGYDTSDSLVYLVPALPLAALWLGRGADEAADWLRGCVDHLGWRSPGRYSVAMVLLIPALQGILFWGEMDLSGDRTAMAWAEQVLEEAPPGAVLLTRSDAHTFTLWYAQGVLSQRPDVVVVDRDLWYQEPYRERIVAALGLTDVEVALSAREAARRAGRPTVELSDGA